MRGSFDSSIPVGMEHKFGSHEVSFALLQLSIMDFEHIVMIVFEDATGGD
jgi:hypothetical protein